MEIHVLLYVSRKFLNVTQFADVSSNELKLCYIYSSERFDDYIWLAYW